MARAWPFENKPEPKRRERVVRPEDFVARRPGTEAVVVRIGLSDAQVVLVDEAGSWQRWVYHSLEEAEEAARRVGVEVHVGEYPEDVRVRMNAFRRPAEDYEVAAYPEQGHTGPVMPYPENRSRPRSPAAKPEDEKRADENAS